MREVDQKLNILLQVAYLLDKAHQCTTCIVKKRSCMELAVEECCY